MRGPGLFCCCLAAFLLIGGAELQVSAPDGTDDAGSFTEGQVAPADPSLDEKSLYAEQIPIEKNLLLSFTDGLETEAQETKPQDCGSEVVEEISVQSDVLKNESLEKQNTTRGVPPCEPVTSVSTEVEDISSEGMVPIIEENVPLEVAEITSDSDPESKTTNDIREGEEDVSVAYESVLEVVENGQNDDPESDAKEDIKSEISPTGDFSEDSDVKEEQDISEDLAKEEQKELEDAPTEDEEQVEAIEEDERIIDNISDPPLADNDSPNSESDVYIPETDRQVNLGSSNDYSGDVTLEDTHSEQPSAEEILEFIMPIGTSEQLENDTGDSNQDDSNKSENEKEESSLPTDQFGNDEGSEESREASGDVEELNGEEEEADIEDDKKEEGILMDVIERETEDGKSETEEEKEGTKETNNEVGAKDKESSKEEVHDQPLNKPQDSTEQKSSEAGQTSDGQVKSTVKRFNKKSARPRKAQFKGSGQAFLYPSS
ncbi:sarcalumenin isoform 1-T1 [Discoglossus pictus]